MARSQLRYNVTDRAGNAVQNALCHVYLEGTTTDIPDLFAGQVGGVALTELTSNDQGEIVGYVDVAKRVDILVTDNGNTAFYPGEPSELLSWTNFTETIEVYQSGPNATPADVAAEQARAEAAELVLTNDLAAEVARATGAEGVIAAALAFLDSQIDQAQIAYKNVANVFTQPQTLPDDPTDPLHAAPKQYVDAGVAAAEAFANGLVTAEALARSNADAALNGLITAETNRALAAEALLAPLASPVLTGNPTAPTPAPGDNDTSISTTAFVTAAVAALDAQIDQANIAYVNVAQTFTQPQVINAAQPALLVKNTGGTPEIRLDGDAAQIPDLRWYRAGVRRWSLRMLNEAESGGNVGSSFSLIPATDAGSLGTVVLNATRSGNIATNSNAVEGTVSVQLNSRAASWVQLVVKGNASQTADALQVQDSTGAVLAKITAAGAITSNTEITARSGGGLAVGIGAVGDGGESAISFRNNALWLKAPNNNLLVAKSASLSVEFQQSVGSVSQATGQLDVIVGSASRVGVVVKGAASQSGDLFQAQTSAGKVIVSVDALGDVVIRPNTGGTTPVDTALFVESRLISTTPVTVRGLSGQTAQLQRWEDSTGAALVAIAADGTIQASKVNISNSGYIGSASTSGNNYFPSASANSIVVVVRGFASQSADLQQWQDSTGAVLTRIKSNGIIGIGSVEMSYANSAVTSNLGFAATTNVAARIGVAAQVYIGDQGPGGEAGMMLGSAADTALFRSAANQVSLLKGGTLRTTRASDGSKGLVIGGGTFGTQIQFYGADNFRASIDLADPDLGVTSNAAGNVPWFVKGAASQTADLFQVRDSTAAVLAGVKSGGHVFSDLGFYSGTNAFTNGIGRSTFVGRATNDIPLSAAHIIANAIVPVAVFRGGASPGAGGDLVAFQDSAAATRSLIGPAGQVRSGSAYDLYVEGGGAGNDLLLNWTSGRSTFVGGVGASAVRLTVKGAASQTGDLFQLQDSAATVLARFNSAGYLGIGTAPGATFPLDISFSGGFGGIRIKNTNTSSSAQGGIEFDSTHGAEAWLFSTNNASSLGRGIVAELANPWLFLIDTASNVGVKIRGAASQSGDLQQWQDSTGAVLQRVTSAGWLGIGVTPVTPVHIQTSGDGAGNNVGFRVTNTFGGTNKSWNVSVDNAYSKGLNFAEIAVADGRLFLQAGGFVGINRVDPGGQLDIKIGAAGSIGVLVNGAASQTADLQQWRKSDGTVYSRLDSIGRLSIDPSGGGLGTSTVDASIVVTARQFSIPIVVVQGLASQTGDLQQWRDSGATVLGKIKAAGGVVLGYSTMADDHILEVDSGHGISLKAGATRAYAQIASNIPFSTRGVASQTGNLFEAQNSAGTALFVITAAGAISAYSNNQTHTLGSTLKINDPSNNPALYWQQNSVDKWLMYTGGSSSMYLRDMANGRMHAQFSPNDATYFSSRIQAQGIGVGDVVTTVKGVASQTGDLLQLVNSAGSVLAKHDSAGRLFISNSLVTNQATKIDDLGVWWGRSTDGALTTFVASSGGSAPDLTLQASNNILFKPSNAVAGSTTTISYTGTAARVNSGEFYASTGLFSTTGNVAGELSADPSAGTDQGWLVRRGTRTAQGATALMSWVYGSGPGTELMRLRTDGTLQINGFAAGVVGQIIKGAASQTSDLIQLQNSAGSVIAKITAGGNVVGVDVYATSRLTTNNNYAMLGEQNSGGWLHLMKESAAPSNPPSGAVRLYLRDGTNPGTLKLIVLGSAGTETTVLDNIAA